MDEPLAWAASSAEATWATRATARAGSSRPSRASHRREILAVDVTHGQEQSTVALAGLVDGST